MKQWCVVAVVLSACSPQTAPRFENDPPLDPVVVDDGGLAGQGGGAGGGGGGDAGGAGGGGATVCEPCTRFGAMSIAGTITNGEIDELSGLAASRLHAGVLYAHNDSGDSARFFALGPTGESIAELVLTGNFKANDWEDMGVGPCPAGSCVFLGDFGDNNRVRTDYAVYRVTEPDVAVGQQLGKVTVAFERFPFQYPNGMKNNAETMLVHPVSGDVYVLTKAPGGEPSRVFKFPQPMKASSMATLIPVATASVPTANDSLLTGGSVAPCGTQVLLRMYNRLVMLTLPEGQPFDAIFTQPPQAMPFSTNELQGEAVAWAADGRSYFTAAEGDQPDLHRSSCTQ